MNRKVLVTLLSIVGLLLGIAPVKSQVIATFENFNLAPGEHLNNASPEDGFNSGSIELPNFYDAEFDYWAGWAISADTNTTTPGFLNQYSAIPGSGALGTTAYGVGYVYDPGFIRLKENAIGKPVIGLYVTNSTYTYYSMRDGDAFAKKFGGESGKDPDFFMLTIKKYAGGVISDDSINVYLADYRSPDPAKDYILNEWRYVDLANLGEVDSLILSLRSSDNGIFGMNTPAYVCIDQVSTDNLLSSSSLSVNSTFVTVHPNPTTETIHMNLNKQGLVQIVNLHGVPVWSSRLSEGRQDVDVRGWPSGVYVITLDGQYASRISIR